MDMMTDTYAQKEKKTTVGAQRMFGRRPGGAVRKMERNSEGCLNTGRNETQCQRVTRVSDAIKELLRMYT